MENQSLLAWGCRGNREKSVTLTTSFRGNVEPEGSKMWMPCHEHPVGTSVHPHKIEQRWGGGICGNKNSVMGSEVQRKHLKAGFVTKERVTKVPGLGGVKALVWVSTKVVSGHHNT